MYFHGFNFIIIFNYVEFEQIKNLKLFRKCVCKYKKSFKKCEKQHKKSLEKCE